MSEPGDRRSDCKNFDVKNFRKEKVKNKLALQEELGLEVNPKTMMIGIVSRLTDQKGFDLISYMMDEMCQDAVQFVILGTGEERYENMFRHFAWKYDKKVFGKHLLFRCNVAQDLCILRLPS